LSQIGAAHALVRMEHFTAKVFAGEARQPHIRRQAVALEVAE
jgi:hypothetical protein